VDPRVSTDRLDGAFAETVDAELPSGAFAPRRRDARAAVAELVARAARGATARGAAQQAARAAGLPGPGAVIGRYRLEEPIGAGGFAVVYRATHLVLDMPVALKLLRPEIVRKNPRLGADLCKEARFAARIDDAGVVRVHDAGHSPRLSYVVMEYIDGCTLADALVGRAPLAPTLVASIGRDVARGLGAALAQGLIHRDVKPSNLLITRAGQAKIVDLGLARALLGDHDATQVVVGTPGYMAPEQASDPEHVDHRADIHALGVTLYLAACGRLPFAERGRARPPAILPEVPPRLGALLLRMLAAAPGQRPSDYGEIIDELAALTAG
jgi:serine/threonine-protein kinase